MRRKVGPCRRLFYAFWILAIPSSPKTRAGTNFNDHTLPKGRPQELMDRFRIAHFRQAVPDLRCDIEQLICGR